MTTWARTLMNKSYVKARGALDAGCMNVGELLYTDKPVCKWFNVLIPIYWLMKNMGRLALAEWVLHKQKGARLPQYVLYGAFR